MNNLLNHSNYVVVLINNFLKESNSFDEYINNSLNHCPLNTRLHFLHFRGQFLRDLMTFP